MALRVNHNIAALDAQRNLALTTGRMNGLMEKLSSGYRINRAADDPAGLVISEQFRAQIAGLKRAISNSTGSINMIQTAEGSLNEINSLLVSMRELAIHAANEGFNDVEQLAADQAEIENAIKTIDRIAANTQFGTKKLLDGSRENIATITSSNTSNLTIIQSGLETGTHSISATKTTDAAVSFNTTSLGISLNGTGTPTNLEEKVYAVDVLQSSVGAQKTSTANITIADGFGNGIRFAATAAAATIHSGNTMGAAATASNAGTYTLQLNYQEYGESVTGDQEIAIAVADTDAMADLRTRWNTAIAANSYLSGKIEMATVGATNQFVIRSVNEGSDFALKMTSSTTTAATDVWDFTGSGDGDGRSNRGVSLNVLKTTAGTYDGTAGVQDVTIGAGTYSTMTALNTALQGALDTAFGANEVLSEVVNDYQISWTTRDEGSTYSLKMSDEDTGDQYNKAQYVLNFAVDSVATSGTDSLVSFDGYVNVLTDVRFGTTHTTTLYNKADDGGANSTRGSLGITVGDAASGIDTGNLLLTSLAARFGVSLDGAAATEAIAGRDTLVYNNDRTQSIKVNYALDSTGGTETISNTDQSLVFQIGANVGQTAQVSLRNMAATALGKGLVANMFNSLSSINVETSQGAQDAQAIIDSAINEVTNTRGSLGSFTKNTLESNLRNLRVAEQNLTASESEIRDTDMASAMSDFIKEQILMQAGTAMLAQANQMPQVVLSLFQ